MPRANSEVVHLGTKRWGRRHLYRHTTERLIALDFAGPGYERPEVAVRPASELAVELPYHCTTIGGSAVAGDLMVSVDESERSALTGEAFTFTSEITNSGSEATPPLIANLAFVAIDHSTYVDPEDWSPQRTVSVVPIAAGSSTTQTWTVRPVLTGDVVVYVVLPPEPPALSGAGPLAASPAIPVHVEEHRTLNPGGVLPVVLAVPRVLAIAAAALRIARERR